MDMIPVLQYPNEDELRQASNHLSSEGYPNRVTLLSDLPTEQHTEWMTPENGGYLLHLPKDDRYDDAMNCLGSFFGCTE